MQNERDEHKQKLRDLEGRKGARETSHMHLQMEFEKERAQWESVKNALQQAKDDAADQLTRTEKKYEVKVSEAERLKQDVKELKKKIYAASGNKMNYEANTIGTGIAGKLGLGAFAKAGNTSGIQGTGASGFKPAGGGFKATGAQRYIGEGS